MNDKYSAKGSMLGYFYQPLYALYLLLQNDLAENANAHLLIENLDDIDFVDSNNQLTLYQTKHHINKQGSISDKSEDLCKTLRIWTERIQNNELDLSDSFFVLTTTVSASLDSIASKLKIDKNLRNTKEALKELIKIAEEGFKAKQEREKDPKLNKNSNEDYYVCFYNLDYSLKNELINRIYILDDSSDITQIQNGLKKELKHACNLSDRDYFLEKLVGWWFYRVISHLNCNNQDIISCIELEDKIGEIREEFKKGNLPIDYENEFNNISESNLSDSEKIFIEQLKIIAASKTCIGNSILDYYKAYQQRCKWVREGKIFNDGLEEYDNRLINEWVRFFDGMRSEINDFENEDELKKAGRKLFTTIEQKNLPICESQTHTNKGFYIMRGSYHVLANNLKIGWHPEYNKRLCHLHPDFKEGKCFVNGFNNKICDLILEASRIV